MIEVEKCFVDKQFSVLKCPHGSRLPLLSWSGRTGDLVRINVEFGGGEYSWELDAETNVLMCGTAIDVSVAIVYPFPTSRKNLFMKYI